MSGKAQADHGRIRHKLKSLLKSFGAQASVGEFKKHGTKYFEEHGWKMPQSIEENMRELQLVWARGDFYASKITAEQGTKQSDEGDSVIVDEKVSCIVHMISSAD